MLERSAVFACTQTGNIFDVVYLSKLMVEKKDSSDKTISRVDSETDGRLEGADARSARVASAGERDQALDKNPNRSDGSLQSDRQKGTFELVEKKEDGSEEVLDSRHVREHRVKSAQITLEQLDTLSQSGNGFAGDLARQFREAKSNAERAQILKHAERICGFEKREESKESKAETKKCKADTGILQAIRDDEALPAEKRDFAKNIQDMRAKSKALGYDTASLDEAAADKLGPEIAAIEGSRSDEIIEGSYTAVKTGEHSYQLNIGVTESVSEQQDVFQRISELPIDKQCGLLGAGAVTFFQEVGRQNFEISMGTLRGTGSGLKSLGDGAVDLVKGIGEVAQFGYDLATNSPDVGDKAAKAGEAVGKILVGGVRLWQVTESYLGEVGATGDYVKPFRDVQWLGNELNERWRNLTPAQQAEMSAKLSTEFLGSIAIPLGAGKLAKCEKVTTFMEEIAAAANGLGKGAKDKTSKYIAQLMDELFAEVAVTPDGQRVRIPRRPDRDETTLMSKAEDVGHGSPDHRPGELGGQPEPTGTRAGDRGQNPEQSDGRRPGGDESEQPRAAERDRPPLDAAEQARLLRLIEQERDSLEASLQDFLRLRNVRIQPVDFVSDALPNLPGAERALGAYDWGNNTIYIPMRVMRGGQPVENFDIAFAIRHEVGHAFNYKALEKPLAAGMERVRPFRMSDKLNGFIRRFDEEFDCLSADDLRTMGFERATEADRAFARDEVFADLFAHAGGTGTNNERSQLMARRFSECLNYMRRNIRE